MKLLCYCPTVETLDTDGECQLLGLSCDSLLSVEVAHNVAMKFNRVQPAYFILDKTRLCTASLPEETTTLRFPSGSSRRMIIVSQQPTHSLLYSTDLYCRRCLKNRGGISSMAYTTTHEVCSSFTIRPTTEIYHDLSPKDHFHTSHWGLTQCCIESRAAWGNVFPHQVP